MTTRAERREAKRQPPLSNPFLDALLDQRVPGGCHDCDAEQYLELADGAYRILVAHDETCPWLKAWEATR